MFKPNSTPNPDRDSFLRQAEDARQKRNLDKKKAQSVLKIQSFYRGYMSRKQLYQSISKQLINTFITPDNSSIKLTAVHLYDLIRNFFFIDKLKIKTKPDTLNQIFCAICKYLTVNIQKSDLKTSYMSLIVSKSHYQNFIVQSNRLLGKCVHLLNEINFKEKEQIKHFETYLDLVLVFTNYHCWKCFEAKPNKGNTM